MLDTRQLNNKPDPSPCLVVEPTRQVPDLVEDVRNGLLNVPRSLPPKYFYDAHGSVLFDKICNTPEYYPTRTEERLLLVNSRDIIHSTQPEQILELGSGTSRKTRHLFDACESIDHTCEYAPFDVCAEMLEETTEKLQDDYDWLNIQPLLGDYQAGLGNLPGIEGTRLFVFLGSTIGNFQRAEAISFINEIKGCMQPGDYLLLGADRVKDNRVLVAAYNDNQGITAEFNLNLLRVLNRELGADFDLCGFDHHAEFNRELKRIEMHLVSNREQEVCLNAMGEVIHFSKGDPILTEISQKFSFEDIESILEQTGLKIIQHHEPGNRYFSLVLAQYDKPGW